MSNQVTGQGSTQLRKALMSCVCWAGVGLAAATTAQAEVKITGDSPFAGCNVSAQPGVVYPNAEVEPWIELGSNQ